MACTIDRSFVAAGCQDVCPASIRVPNLFRPFGFLIQWVRFASQKQRQRRALHDLDDRMLTDIGLTRKVAREEAAKPFWL